MVVAAHAGAEDSAAAQVVSQLHKAFESVLREAETLGYEGRRERLEPAIEKAFDSEFMARAAIGRQWKKLSEEDRIRWVKSFRAFSVANYASRLDHYAGQSFETLGEKPGQNQTVFVLTRVVEPDAEDVELNYRLRETEEGWKVIDLYAKGTVSELALRRSEYSSVLKEDGFEALLAMLDAKTADLAAGNAAP
jgi:phospholipid transport system substrate-binding protein